eukprot:gene11097-17055_t
MLRPLRLAVWAAVGVVVAGASCASYVCPSEMIRNATATCPNTEAGDCVPNDPGNDDACCDMQMCYRIGCPVGTVVIDNVTCLVWDNGTCPAQTENQRACCENATATCDGYECPDPLSRNSAAAGAVCTGPDATCRLSEEHTKLCCAPTCPSDYACPGDMWLSSILPLELCPEWNLTSGACVTPSADNAKACCQLPNCTLSGDCPGMMTPFFGTCPDADYVTGICLGNAEACCAPPTCQSVPCPGDSAPKPDLADESCLDWGRDTGLCDIPGRNVAYCCSPPVCRTLSCGTRDHVSRYLDTECLNWNTSTGHCTDLNNGNDELCCIPPSCAGYPCPENQTSVADADTVSCQQRDSGTCVEGAVNDAVCCTLDLCVAVSCTGGEWERCCPTCEDYDCPGDTVLVKDAANYSCVSSESGQGAKCELSTENMNNCCDPPDCATYVCSGNLTRSENATSCAFVDETDSPGTCLPRENDGVCCDVTCRAFTCNSSSYVRAPDVEEQVCDTDGDGGCMVSPYNEATCCPTCEGYTGCPGETRLKSTAAHIPCASSFAGGGCEPTLANVYACCTGSTCEAYKCPSNYMSVGSPYPPCDHVDETGSCYAAQNDAVCCQATCLAFACNLPLRRNSSAESVRCATNSSGSCALSAENEAACCIDLRTCGGWVCYPPSLVNLTAAGTVCPNFDEVTGCVVSDPANTDMCCEMRCAWASATWSCDDDHIFDGNLACAGMDLCQNCCVPVTRTCGAYQCPSGSSPFPDASSIQCVDTNCTLSVENNAACCTAPTCGGSEVCPPPSSPNLAAAGTVCPTVDVGGCVWDDTANTDVCCQVRCQLVAACDDAGRLVDPACEAETETDCLNSCCPLVGSFCSDSVCGDQWVVKPDAERLQCVDITNGACTLAGEANLKFCCHPTCATFGATICAPGTTFTPGSVCTTRGQPWECQRECCEEAAPSAYRCETFPCGPDWVAAAARAADDCVVVETGTCAGGAANREYCCERLCSAVVPNPCQAGAAAPVVQVLQATWTCTAGDDCARDCCAAAAGCGGVACPEHYEVDPRKAGLPCPVPAASGGSCALDSAVNWQFCCAPACGTVPCNGLRSCAAAGTAPEDTCCCKATCAAYACRAGFDPVFAARQVPCPLQENGTVCVAGTASNEEACCAPVAVIDLHAESWEDDGLFLLVPGGAAAAAEHLARVRDHVLASAGLTCGLAGLNVRIDSATRDGEAVAQLTPEIGCRIAATLRTPREIVSRISLASAPRAVVPPPVFADTGKAQASSAIPYEPLDLVVDETLHPDAFAEGNEILRRLFAPGGALGDLSPYACRLTRAMWVDGDGVLLLDVASAIPVGQPPYVADPHDAARGVVLEAFNRTAGAVARTFGVETRAAPGPVPAAAGPPTYCRLSDLVVGGAPPTEDAVAAVVGASVLQYHASNESATVVIWDPVGKLSPHGLCAKAVVGLNSTLGCSSTEDSWLGPQRSVVAFVMAADGVRVTAEFEARVLAWARESGRGAVSPDAYLHARVIDGGTPAAAAVIEWHGSSCRSITDGAFLLVELAVELFGGEAQLDDVRALDSYPLAGLPASRVCVLQEPEAATVDDTPAELFFWKGRITTTVPAVFSDEQGITAFALSRAAAVAAAQVLSFSADSLDFVLNTWPRRENPSANITAHLRHLNPNVVDAVVVPLTERETTLLHIHVSLNASSCPLFTVFTTPPPAAARKGGSLYVALMCVVAGTIWLVMLCSFLVLVRERRRRRAARPQPPPGAGPAPKVKTAGKKHTCDVFDHTAFGTEMDIVGSTNSSEDSLRTSLLAKPVA